MKKFLPVFLIVQACAGHITSDELQLLKQDKQNKLLEIECLQEMEKAQHHDDIEAFRYYLQRYLEVERLEIPEKLKKSSHYFVGGLNLTY